MGPPPPSIQLEEAGQRVPWGPAVELAQEGPPLLPLGLGLMEVDGAEQVLEDGATVEDATGRGDQLLTSAILSRMAVGLPIVAVGVGVLFGGHVLRRVDLHHGTQTDRLTLEVSLVSSS